MIEIEGVTFGFEGGRLNPQNACKRMYDAGFVNARLLATAYAVFTAESGRYLRAFHHNVLRNEDGTILLDGAGKMTVVSTDLGWIQRNVVHDPPKLISPDEVDSHLLVNDLFEQRPDLANGQESANVAYALWLQRGWQPWVAYRNESYEKGLPSACVAVGRYLAMALCGNAEIVIHNPKYT